MSAIASTNEDAIATGTGDRESSDDDDIEEQCVIISSGTRRLESTYTGGGENDWPQVFPWAKLTASTDSAHLMQNTRKPKKGPRVLTGEVFARRYLQCADCAAHKDVAKNNKACNNEWIEGKGWWTTSLLQKHEDLQSHIDAVAATQMEALAAAQTTLGSVASSPSTSIITAMQRSALAADQEAEVIASAEATARERRETEERRQSFEQRAALVRMTLKMAWQGQALGHLNLEVQTAAANGANVPKSGKYGSHTTREGATGFTMFMSDLSKEEVDEAVGDAVFWSVVADGSSDRSMKHAVAVVVMWINRKGEVHTDLWDIVECGGGAADQFNMLKAEFKNLNWDTLIGGSFDGASVNFGKRSGLATRVSNVAAFALFCHCCGHRVALCSKAAAKASEFAKHHLDVTQRMFRRYCWSGVRRDELRAICEELGIKYMAPKLIMDVRFLSCADVTMTMNKTIKGHITKAFDDVDETLADHEFMDDYQDLASSKRLKVTAADVVREAGTTSYVFANPVFSYILDQERIFATSCQTRLGGEGNIDGTIGEIPALVDRFRAELQQYLDNDCDSWQAFNSSNEPVAFSAIFPAIADFRTTGDNISVLWRTSEATEVSLAAPQIPANAGSVQHRKTLSRNKAKEEIVNGIRDYVECFLEELNDRFPSDTLDVYRAFRVFDLHCLEWHSFAEGRNDDFGFEEMEVLSAHFGTEKEVMKSSELFEVDDTVEAPWNSVGRSRASVYTGEVMEVFESGGLKIKWSDGQTLKHNSPGDVPNLKNTTRVTKPALVDCRRLKNEWIAFRAMMLAKNAGGIALYIASGKSKRIVLQNFLADTVNSHRVRNVLRLMMIEAVSTCNSMQAERVFSAHNTVKTARRNGLDLRTSAAQCRSGFPTSAAVSHVAMQSAQLLCFSHWHTVMCYVCHPRSSAARERLISKSRH